MCEEHPCLLSASITGSLTCSVASPCSCCACQGFQKYFIPSLPLTGILQINICPKIIAECHRVSSKWKRSFCEIIWKLSANFPSAVDLIAFEREGSLSSSLCLRFFPWAWALLHFNVGTEQSHSIAGVGQASEEGKNWVSYNLNGEIHAELAEGVMLCTLSDSSAMSLLMAQGLKLDDL